MVNNINIISIALFWYYHGYQNLEAKSKILPIRLIIFYLDIIIKPIRLI